MKKILVTGGAGYIGSVAVKNLIEQGYSVIVVDNLSRGDSLLAYIQSVATFYKLDLATEREKLENVFKEHAIDAVMHFAAYKSVEESMENPGKYKDNVVGTEQLLEVMAGYGVPILIFSSSAAVYSPPAVPVPLQEDDPLGPVNVYGETKLQCEQRIEEFCTKNNIQFVNLRYFNVAGDGGLHYVEPKAENVLPVIMESLVGMREEFVIFGDDYATKDGTCIRDYIHVSDLVRAHIQALDASESMTLNLGTSKGYSVLDLVHVVEEISGQKLRYRFGVKRKGDPAVLVASFEKAKSKIGWNPERTLEEMVRSELETYQTP